MKCPCVLECPGRSAECHATCGKYKAWVEYNEKRKQWLRDQLPPTSEQSRKGEIRKLRSKLRGYVKSKRGDR